MNYKLVKQLQKAGFPQEKWWKYYKDGSREPIYPTLNKLIDACGDKFHALIHNPMDKNTWWTAEAENMITEEGKTPLEAVARLYIKLKEYD